ncbi:CTP synthase (glutamine hydrolyzing) [Candidatus Woesearchaeota archaeon]|nr:MAG: CTP synthase (glutamine hydrolyzing) [Candidatus Woesearchaeota archaeon]
MPTKYIVVTGGVLSGLGKGIAAASIGFLLSSQKRVIPVKCEGYLNIDPGTMNPIEHGEVFVLDDGEEADMDFGHYERFLGISCKAHWNVTMGKIYQSIFEKERKGEYLGKTVQMIPHVTDQIKETWKSIAEEENADVMLIEIGGTVGDIETEMHIEAARQLKHDLGEENVCYIHLTYVPIPPGVGEQKSKPTQQSVGLLRQKGIQPDIIIGRCSEYLEEGIKKKIATFCDVSPRAVITGLDVDSIYKIPLVFYNEGLMDILNEKLQMNVRPNLREWSDLVQNIAKADDELTIAIAGKYTALEDSYASVVEAIHHACAHLKARPRILWVETTNAQELLKLEEADAIIVPGGFGTRGVEGKIDVIRFARENRIPFLGICLGLQLAVVEHARNKCELPDAHSAEMKEHATHCVVDILPEQKGITQKGGTMRLGAYEAVILKDSLVYRLYNAQKVSERHRHRYEVNPEYHQVLETRGLRFSGKSENGRLVEFLERTDHPFFVATQAHPELKSSLLKPAPLFFGLCAAALHIKKERETLARAEKTS